MFKGSKSNMTTQSELELQRVQDLCQPYLEDCSVSTLDYKNHIKFLTKPFKSILPIKFTTLDASHPWIIFWCLNSLALLNIDVSQYKRDVIYSISKLQSSSGGFMGGEGQIAHVVTSYAAVCALKLVKADLKSVIDVELMHAWLLQNKQEDGSFSAHEGGEIDSRSVYCALVIAHLLDLDDYRLYSNVLNWLKQCQSEFDGGLAGVPATESHGGYAFCVVAAATLATLYESKDSPTKEVEIFNNKRLVEWLVDRQTAQGGFNGRSNKLVDGCYSWWIGGTIALVSQFVNLDHDISALLNKSLLRQYILRCCQSPRGGLCDKPELPSDYYHSCYVLSGLASVQYRYHFSISENTKTWTWRFEPLENQEEPLVRPIDLILGTAIA